MYDMLVTFGDSWPAGAELKHYEKPFGEILSENLNCKFINQSIGASCIDSMLLQLQQFLEKSYDPGSRTCAVFFVTSYHRALLFDQPSNLPRSIYPMEDHADPTVKNYFKYVHSDKLNRFRANLAILALQKICSEYKIDDKYLIGWLDPGFDYPGISKDKIFSATAAEILGVSSDHECSTNSNHKYFYPNRDHPNQLGHKIIADWLLEKIKKDDLTH